MANKTMQSGRRGRHGISMKCLFYNERLKFDDRIQTNTRDELRNKDNYHSPQLRNLSLYKRSLENLALDTLGATPRGLRCQLGFQFSVSLAFGLPPSPDLTLYQFPLPARTRRLPFSLTFDNR